MKHLKKSWKCLASFAMAAAMVAALLPTTVFAAEGTYTAVSLTNAEALSYSEDLYVQVGDSYEKVTVDYTEGQTTTVATYTDASGNAVDEADVQSTWTDSNGTTYTEVYEYTGESSSQPVYGDKIEYFTDVHTYTRTTKSTTVLFSTVTYYYYVDDETGEELTYSLSVLSDTNARKEFLDYFEGTNYYTNGYKCVYGSYAFAIVMPVTKTETTETTDAVYSYSADGMDTVTSTGADSATPVTLYTYAEHTHTAGEAVVENEVAATCTEDGSYDSVEYCSVCGEEISRETVTVPATGHSWNEGEVTTEATCTEEGEITYTCTVCGETKTETIAATGHTAGEAVKENEVAATCTEDGSYDSVVYCTVCNEEISRETITVEATGHTVVTDAAVAATCTETGLTEGSHCSVCNEVIVAQEEIPALGHTWDDGVVTTEATCTEAGVMTYTCTVCGETKTEEIEATGHTVVTDAAVAATCTETGLTEGSHCSVCGEVIVAQEEIPALGHTEAEAVVENEVAATCTEDGSYDSIVYCSVCGEEISRETVTVEATGHTAGEAVIENEVAATATEDGSYDSVVYCTVCGEEISRETVVVPATGHHYGEPTFEWSEDYSTCTATFACEDEDCDDEETVECTVTSETSFTCTEGGETVYTATCTFGEEEYSDTKTVEIEATGSHTYGKWTGNYDETIYRTCSVCGEIEVADNTFTDLVDNVYYVPVVWASYYGITTGKTETTFVTGTDCTRAQIVTFLWRAAGCPEPEESENPFTDVSESAYYYKAVLWAYENGITEGTTATTFSPSSACTRAQIVTFLWRYAGKPEVDSELSFSDVTYATDSDFYKAIIWASETGVTNGFSDGTFRPTYTCTRGQAVTFIFGYYTEILDKDPTK